MNGECIKDKKREEQRENRENETKMENREKIKEE